ncbi:hypothetical protein [Magnetospira thiophila]
MADPAIALPQVTADTSLMMLRQQLTSEALVVQMISQVSAASPAPAVNAGLSGAAPADLSTAPGTYLDITV